MAGLKTTLVIAAVLLCLAGNAAAGVMAQCADDAHRLCADVKQKRLYDCLRKHASKLSFACADVVGQKNTSTGHVCQNDAMRLCGSRKMNKANRRCLEHNFDRLSSDCQSYFYGLGWVR